MTNSQSRVASSQPSTTSFTNNRAAGRYGAAGWWMFQVPPRDKSNPIFTMISLGKSPPGRLGDFILENLDRVLDEWEDVASSTGEVALLGSSSLRRNAETILRMLVEDMKASHVPCGENRRSDVNGAGDHPGLYRAATDHAIAWANNGFDLRRMMGGFSALRAAVSGLWWSNSQSDQSEAVDDFRHFDEALDRLVVASVSAFHDRIDRSRRLFLGILGHDLRQPLYSVKMFADVLEKTGDPSSIVPIASRIARCCDGMGTMLKDLLDFTSTQMGETIPVYPSICDLGVICSEVVEEMRVSSPGVEFSLERTGDLGGEWDACRLRQLISNLLTNALQHGRIDQPIRTMLHGSGEHVILAVHNMGPPIPHQALGILFDPLVRMGSERDARPHGSVGLGLYICRQIAIAHGGEINVESSLERGTVFTVELPRHLARKELA